MDGRALQRWGLFFAGVLVAWAALFAASASLSMHAPAALGPGMAWLEAALAGFMPLCGKACMTLGHGAAAHGQLLFLVPMWLLMAVAMMAPTAVPVLRAYGDLRHADPGRVTAAGFWAFLGGYLVVWAGFALAAAPAQQALGAAGWVDGLGVSRSPLFSAALLAAAGLYQFSALKQACLTQCRSPMAFFLSYWREGVDGAFQMGLRHGAICVACCWALMALAFVGGTMNLLWMGAAMVLMIVEKLPLGRRLTAPLGYALLGTALLVAGRALLDL